MACATHVTELRHVTRPTSLAFTLAEVLVVLGIIGLIADMTVPTLVNSYEKQIVVTRLQKFYSSMNQAVRLSEIENGPFSQWDSPPYNDGAELEKWYEKYISKYLRVVSQDTSGKYIRLAFSDGSGTTCYGSLWFFCTKFKYCQSELEEHDGKRRFIFENTKTGIEPYTFVWDGTRENLIIGSPGSNGERHNCKKNVGYGHCAKLIQYDGWKISKDYPWFN